MTAQCVARLAESRNYVKKRNSWAAYQSSSCPSAPSTANCAPLNVTGPALLSTVTVPAVAWKIANPFACHGPFKETRSRWPGYAHQATRLA